MSENVKDTNVPWVFEIAPRLAGKDVGVTWQIKGSAVSREEAIAKARLLAAAPNTLDACETALALIVARFGECNVAYKLIAAIDKAKGRESEIVRRSRPLSPNHWGG